MKNHLILGARQTGKTQTAVEIAADIFRKTGQPPVFLDCSSDVNTRRVFTQRFAKLLDIEPFDLMWTFDASELNQPTVIENIETLLKYDKGVLRMSSLYKILEKTSDEFIITSAYNSEVADLMRSWCLRDGREFKVIETEVKVQQL